MLHMIAVIYHSLLFSFEIVKIERPCNLLKVVYRRKGVDPPVCLANNTITTWVWTTHGMVV